MTSRFIGNGVYNILPSSKSLVNATNWHSTVRHDGDIMYHSEIVIQNAVVGSRYWLARAADDGVISIGIVSASSFTVADIPVYENPMLVKIRLRNASGSPRYVPYETYVYLGRNGATAYISQIADVL